MQISTDHLHGETLSDETAHPEKDTTHQSSVLPPLPPPATLSFTMDLIIHNRVTKHTGVYPCTINAKASDHHPNRTYRYDYFQWENRVPKAFIEHLKDCELIILDVMFNADCLPHP